MWCTRCNKQLHECICPDREERLAKISESPYLATRYCKKCMKHYAVCKCENPEWSVRAGGQDIAGAKAENETKH